MGHDLSRVLEHHNNQRMDASVVVAVQALVDGTFTGGTHIDTLETGEVGLAPFPQEVLTPSSTSACIAAPPQDVQTGFPHTPLNRQWCAPALGCGDMPAPIN
jgi:hypothetical protein